jgi:hypothetical protein
MNERRGFIGRMLASLGFVTGSVYVAAEATEAPADCGNCHVLDSQHWYEFDGPLTEAHLRRALNRLRFDRDQEPELISMSPGNVDEYAALLHPRRRFSVLGADPSGPFVLHMGARAIVIRPEPRLPKGRLVLHVRGSAFTHEQGPPPPHKSEAFSVGLLKDKP